MMSIETPLNDMIPPIPPISPSPWLTVKEAADRARCGPKMIYRQVRNGKLEASQIGGRRELRFLFEWVDAWVLKQKIEKTIQ